MLTQGKYRATQSKTTSKALSKAHTNDAEVLSYYSMLIYSRQNACVKHSNFFEVNDKDPDPNQINDRIVLLKNVRHDGYQTVKQNGPHQHTSTRLGPGQSRQISNYELFNCNNFNIH